MGSAYLIALGVNFTIVLGFVGIGNDPWKGVMGIFVTLGYCTLGTFGTNHQPMGTDACNGCPKRHMTMFAIENIGAILVGPAP